MEQRKIISNGSSHTETGNKLRANDCEIEQQKLRGGSAAKAQGSGGKFENFIAVTRARYGFNVMHKTIYNLTKLAGAEEFSR